jgi:hypothetical protein
LRDMRNGPRFVKWHGIVLCGPVGCLPPDGSTCVSEPKKNADKLEQPLTIGFFSPVFNQDMSGRRTPSRTIHADALIQEEP